MGGFTWWLQGLPGFLPGKESTCNIGDLGLMLGLGGSPGGRHCNPLQYCCLENPHGQRSLACYSPWGHKGSDTTERLSTHLITTDTVWFSQPSCCLCSAYSSLSLTSFFPLLFLSSFGLRIVYNSVSSPPMIFLIIPLCVTLLWLL